MEKRMKEKSFVQSNKVSTHLGVEKSRGKHQNIVFPLHENHHV